MAFLPLIAAAVSIGSGVVGAIGASKKAEAEAQAAEYNANIQRTQATQAILQSQEEERRIRQQGAKALGQSRANIAASGLTLDASALDVLAESSQNVELDALTARHSGKMKAWALQSGATLDTMRASSAREAGSYGAASSLLGGVSSAAGQFDIYGRRTAGKTG